MIDCPKTKAEAKACKYGEWAGWPRGMAYNPACCAYEIWEDMHSFQCSRKNGHGPDGLYCKQHAKMIERKEDR